MTWVVATVAGSLGAALRYLVGGAVQRRGRGTLPVGTAAVNLTGAFVLGVILGTGHSGWPWIAAAAVMGGFTTFSTWMVETVALGVVPRPSLRAVINLYGLAALGVLVVALGYYSTN
ncbi:MAG TPA: CrcB family protein [Acidimicrobiia bacterium]|jgi:CrcB protein|nr:CrcB family protein [Acidimicrobiia bacterium]